MNEKQLNDEVVRLIVELADADLVDRLKKDLAHTHDMDQELLTLDSQKVQLAQKGETAMLASYLEVLIYFEYPIELKLYLHFFAQSEANRGLKLKTEDNDLAKEYFERIAKAFELANLLDGYIKS